MLLHQALQIIPVVPWFQFRRIPSKLIQRSDDDKQTALVHVLWVDLVMLEELHQHLIFLFFGELIGNGLAMEVIAVDIVDREEEDMHHVIIEQIGKQDLFAQPKNAVFQVKTRLLRQVLVGIDDALPISLREQHIIRGEAQIICFEDFLHL